MNNTISNFYLWILLWVCFFIWRARTFLYLGRQDTNEKNIAPKALTPVSNGIFIREIKNTTTDKTNISTKR